RRNELLPHIQSFVRNNVRKGDEVAIFTWALSLKPELEPTSDYAAVDATLKRVAEHTTLGGQGKSDFKQFQDQIMFLIRSYREAGMTPPWNEAISAARMY